MTGDIAVALESDTDRGGFIERKLLLTRAASPPRTVAHMQLITPWPDFSIPDETDPMIDLIYTCQASPRPLNVSVTVVGVCERHTNSQSLISLPWQGPMVVHCRAGLGRTGTFIAITQYVAPITDIAQYRGCLNLFFTRIFHHQGLCHAERAPARGRGGDCGRHAAEPPLDGGGP